MVRVRTRYVLHILKRGRGGQREEKWVLVRRVLDWTIHQSRSLPFIPRGPSLRHPPAPANRVQTGEGDEKQQVRAGGRVGAAEVSLLGLKEGCLRSAPLLADPDQDPARCPVRRPTA
ncbi:hypothetical protein NDU88_004821 [Pleurodeles waltl]|uniref:Uncharacterized protein n=1 Tax=Pleurodeles waltl TaxID=8319 RepID=A0AAV7PGV8_PLEWA|nr:hypothetical protein NDU88_004821 [Pleurodeles waltl]